MFFLRFACYVCILSYLSCGLVILEEERDGFEELNKVGFVFLFFVFFS